MDDSFEAPPPATYDPYLEQQPSSDETEPSDGRLGELLQESSATSIPIKVEDDPSPVKIKIEEKETAEASVQASCDQATGTEDLVAESSVQTEAMEASKSTSPTSPAESSDEKTSSKKRSRSRRRRRRRSSSNETKRLRRIGMKCLEQTL